MFTTPQTSLCSGCLYTLPCDVVADNDTVHTTCPKCGGSMISIDSMIVDSIAILWKNGLRTVFSCSGHDANSKGVIKYPHVTFRYSEKIHLFLHQCRLDYYQQENTITLLMWMSTISDPRVTMINFEINSYMEQHATTDEIFDEFRRFLAYVATRSVTFNNRR